MKTPGGGHRRPPHSVSTSPIAVRTRKHRHSRQTSRGSARSRPFFAFEWPNDAGQVGGKVFATQEKALRHRSRRPKPSKIDPGPSKFEPGGFQNRAESPPRLNFQKTSNLRGSKRAVKQTRKGQNGQLGANSIELPRGGATAASPFVCRNVGGLPCI